MHDYEAKCLHLVYPGLIFFAEFGNGRPLILAPEQLTLIRIVNRAVEVDCFVIVSLPCSDIFLQPLVSYQRDVGRSSTACRMGAHLWHSLGCSMKLSPFPLVGDRKIGVRGGKALGVRWDLYTR